MTEKDAGVTIPLSTQSCTYAGSGSDRGSSGDGLNSAEAFRARAARAPILKIVPLPPEEAEKAKQIKTEAMEEARGEAFAAGTAGMDKVSLGIDLYKTERRPLDPRGLAILILSHQTPMLSLAPECNTMTLRFLREPFPGTLTIPESAFKLFLDFADSLLTEVLNSLLHFHFMSGKGHTDPINAYHVIAVLKKTLYIT